MPYPTEISSMIVDTLIVNYGNTVAADVFTGEEGEQLLP